MTSDSPSHDSLASQHAISGNAASEPVTLGDYRLVRQLGSGGMGAVYEAVHVRLERRVAVKVLAANRLKDADSVARFEREMKAIGKLNHPNIIQALDAREEAGLHFLVLEYVEGADLSEVSHRLGQLPVADACEMIRQAAMGLQSAHEQGLVHRDIKPSNLFLALTRNNQGAITAATVKVLDLGLALLSGEPHGEELTTTGQVMGTLDYIAPEQIQDTHQVDIRADLYGLGCTLYKLLAGKAPFADSQGAVRKMRAHADLQVPNILEIRPEIPPDVVAILDRLLAKQPADRFATPQELATALVPHCVEADLCQLATALPVHKNDDGTQASALSQQLTSHGRTETFSQTPPQEAVAPTQLVSREVEQKTAAYSPANRGRRGVWVGYAAAAVLLVPLVYWGWHLSNFNKHSGDDEQSTGEQAWQESWEDTANRSAPNQPNNSTSREVLLPGISPSNRVLSFDGTDDYVVIESLKLEDISPEQPLTIEFAVRQQASSASNMVSWLGANWLAVYEAGGSWGVAELLDGEATLKAGATPSVTDQWVYLAAVRDALGWRLYVDGVNQILARKDFPLMPTEGGLYIGGVPLEKLTGHTTGRWVRGEIDEVRISTIARYKGESYQVTQTLSADPDTLALYHFDELEGTIIVDSSGNSHHGRSVGASRIDTSVEMPAEGQ